MKITITCPNMSSNGAGRAFILAEALAKVHSVCVFGPSFGGGLWEPLINSNKVEYRLIEVANNADLYWKLPELINLIDGDAIYA